MALGPIPYRAILAWASYEQLDREETDAIVRVIMVLERDRIERETSARRLKEA